MSRCLLMGLVFMCWPVHGADKVVTFVKLRLEEKSAPAPSFFMLKSLPARGDFEVDDDCLKTRIMEVMAEMDTGQSWYLVKKHSTAFPSFSHQLVKRLKNKWPQYQFKVTSPRMNDPNSPSRPKPDPGDPRGDVFRVKIKYKPAPEEGCGVEKTGLDMVVHTNTVENGALWTEMKTLEEAGLVGPLSERERTVRVLITGSDGAHEPLRPLTSVDPWKGHLKVVAQAFKKCRVLLEKRDKNDALVLRNQITKEMNTIYRLNRANEAWTWFKTGIHFFKVGEDAHFGARAGYRVTLDKVNAPRRDVRITSLRIDGKNYLWDPEEHVWQQRLAPKMEEHRRTLAKDPVWDKLDGRIVTAVEFREILEQFRKEHKQVLSTEGVLDGDDFFTAVAWKSRVTDLRGGLAYSLEKELTGKLDFSKSLIFHRDDAFSASVEGGEAYVKGDVSYRAPYLSATQKRLWAELSLNAEYEDDKDLKLNSLETNDLTQTQSRVTLLHVLKYGDYAAVDRFLKKDRWQSLYRLETGVVFEDTELKEGAESTELLLDGAVSKLKAVLETEFSRGVGVNKAKLKTSIEWERALASLGGDYTYTRFQGSVTWAMHLKAARNKGWLFRQVTAFGDASETTPAFDQFKLGGDNYLRGLEEGALVGRGYTALTLETGPSLWTLMSLFIKGKEDEEESIPSAGALDLTNTYLKLAYDWADVTDRTEVGEMPLGGDDFRSVGLALEIPIPQGELTLGYAWPLDLDGESGRMFVSLMFQLNNR